MESKNIKFEYGFLSVNGIVKKHYYLHDIPNIKEKCDVWNMLPIIYVRQFTGLHDKNGVEIYCGDILHFGNKNYAEVIFDNGSFCIYQEPIGWDFDSEEFPVRTDFRYCEVVGNIHENPELLKK